MRLCLVMSLVAGALLAADRPPEWPGFRGPLANPSGDNAKLPVSWSTTSNVEWSAEIPGLGWSSPIVSGKYVFLTTVTTDGAAKQPQKGTTYSNDYSAELRKQGLEGKELRAKLNARDFEFPDEVSLHYFLYALDLDTGRVRWKREFYSGKPPGGRHRKNSFCSETPVTDGKRVYVYINNLGAYAFDFKGNPVWTSRQQSFPTVHDFGTASSPVLVNDLLVFVNDNEQEQFIAALDKHTGKQVWRTARQIHLKGSDRQTGWSTPYIWKHSLRTEIVTIGPAVAISYDLEGKELWRLGGMGAMPIPSPYAYDGLLYLNGGTGKAVAAVKPGATGDITAQDGAKLNEYVAWLQPKAGTYLPTQLAYQGGIYVLTHTGILTRFDAKTGIQTYKTRVGEGGDYTSSPWAYDGKIFCINEEGRTFVIQAGEKFELLHTNDLGEMALATPAMVGDRLLLRTEKHLYSIRDKK
ncbi:serine/threonine protein kinase [Bryobacterales bacterium F-183]|nr:serine/threonine protein kinase [Bryobacterales bacterium F-183]